MVDHRHAEAPLRPRERLGVEALAGEEQRAETREVVTTDELALGILLTDRAERGRRREQGADAGLFDHAPERACVRGSDRLAFVQDGRAAVEQRRVDRVRVAYRPADV